MIAERFDIIIVGGGVAGGAFAAVTARGGARVLLLERRLRFEDLGLGEWIAPWGVAEARRLGLYDALLAAGGHHVARHVSYDESLASGLAEAAAVPLARFVKDVPGPLSIAYPAHCEALWREAVAAGAVAVRGARLTSLSAGVAPSVAYVAGGDSRSARAPLLVGADGRGSAVRRMLGVTLRRRVSAHIFAGLAVDVDGWDPAVEASGTEGDFSFLALPQGGGRLRLYGAYAVGTRRFAGPDRAYAFLDAFRLRSAPAGELIAHGRPAGPFCPYRADCGAAEPVWAPGLLLIGDAAGWTDPIVGTGLASAYRDVRLAGAALAAAAGPGAAGLADYAAERRERMRRLAVAAALQAALMTGFGDKGRERRRRYYSRLARDPSIAAHMAAVLAGPEMVPPEAFTPRHRARLLRLPAPRRSGS